MAMLGHVFALGRLFFDLFRFFFVIASAILFYIDFSPFFFHFGSMFEGFRLVLGGFGEGFFDDFSHYHRKSRFLKK